MENKRDSQNIYFKDLLFTALHRWRILLVVALVGALLLGSMQLIPRLTGSNNAAEDAYLAEKKQKAWVESFSVAGSMIVGMAAAVVIGLLVK